MFHIEAMSEKSTLIRCNDKQMIVDVPIEDINQAWYNWQIQGQFVQDAFKFLGADEREFLMTGITPDEWNKIFENPESHS
jgi:hypothetical protein